MRCSPQHHTAKGYQCGCVTNLERGEVGREGEEEKEWIMRVCEGVWGGRCMRGRVGEGVGVCGRCVREKCVWGKVCEMVTCVCDGHMCE